jgi:Ras homolog gene family, member A
MGATYVECSSKEMRGVDRVFELAVNTVIEAEENSYDDVKAPSGGSGAMAGKKVKKRSCKFL